MSSIYSDSTDRLCYPGRISGENTVVLRCTGKFYAAQFHDELVDDLLNLFLRECTLTKVALCIDV